MSDTYTWDWVNGMHIGYTPERIRVEGRGGAVEYVPDAGTCLDVGGGYTFRCSECGCELDRYRAGNSYTDDGVMSQGGDYIYGPRFCPNCGAKVERR